MLKLPSAFRKVQSRLICRINNIKDIFEQICNDFGNVQEPLTFFHIQLVHMKKKSINYFKIPKTRLIKLVFQSIPTGATFILTLLFS